MQTVANGAEITVAGYLSQPPGDIDAGITKEAENVIKTAGERIVHADLLISLRAGGAGTDLTRTGRIQITEVGTELQAARDATGGHLEQRAVCQEIAATAIGNRGRVLAA